MLVNAQIFQKSHYTLLHSYLITIEFQIYNHLFFRFATNAIITRFEF